MRRMPNPCCGVKVSPRMNIPSSNALTGARKVTMMPLVAPTDFRMAKYSRGVMPVLRTARARTATIGTVPGMDSVQG